jgi:Lrp/AsnC family transcriptional regulator for asnA, asnC and gidA
MHKIDHFDLAIVNLLMEDGRKSSSDIARQISDITERSVRYRLNRLVKEGIIKISAIAKPLALGFTVIADVFIEVEPSQILQVAHRLVEYDCVSYVACSTGERDVSIQVIARSNAEVYSFVTEIVGKIPGVRKTTTSIVLLILKDVYDWRIPRSTCTKRRHDED